MPIFVQNQNELPLDITESPVRRLRAFGRCYLNELALSIARWGVVAGPLGALVAWRGPGPSHALSPAHAFIVSALVMMAMRFVMAVFPRSLSIKGKLVSCYDVSRKNYWRIDDLRNVEILPAAESYSILRFSDPSRRGVKTFSFAIPVGLTGKVRERLIDRPSLPQPAIGIDSAVGTLNYRMRRPSRRPWIFLAMWSMVCFYVILALACFCGTMVPRFAQFRNVLIALGLFFLVSACVFAAKLWRWQQSLKAYTDVDERA